MPRSSGPARPGRESAPQAAGRADFRSRLNPEQLAAVTHDGGPLLVGAGAGSGKTRVITYRIAWLIAERGIEPWRIAAVTFTNKAADEMRGRALDLVGGNASVFVGTFHRFCVRLLRRFGDRAGLRPDFAIVDAPDQLRLIKESLKAEDLDDQTFQPRAVQGRISAAKNRLLTPAAFEDRAEDFFDRHVAAVFRALPGRTAAHRRRRLRRPDRARRAPAARRRGGRRAGSGAAFGTFSWMSFRTRTRPNSNS